MSTGSYKIIVFETNSAYNLADGNVQLLKIVLFNSWTFYIKLPRKLFH